MLKTDLSSLATILQQRDSAVGAPNPIRSVPSVFLRGLGGLELTLNRAFRQSCSENSDSLKESKCWKAGDFFLPGNPTASVKVILLSQKTNPCLEN